MTTLLDDIENDVSSQNEAKQDNDNETVVSMPTDPIFVTLVKLMHLWLNVQTPCCFMTTDCFFWNSRKENENVKMLKQNKTKNMKTCSATNRSVKICWSWNQLLLYILNINAVECSYSICHSTKNNLKQWHSGAVFPLIFSCYPMH